MVHGFEKQRRSRLAGEVEPGWLRWSWRPAEGPEAGRDDFQASGFPGGQLVLLPVPGIRLRDKARLMNQVPSLPFKEVMCLNFITIFSTWTVSMG